MAEELHLLETEAWCWWMNELTTATVVLFDQLAAMEILSARVMEMEMEMEMKTV